jgi:glycerol-3-phosphate dehydrogenase
MSAALNAARRQKELDGLAGGEVVDLLVVGGGITGVGVALDAASRGLSVALLERSDLAAGTSRWSSKLVHGGLRYLAAGDVGIAYESAVERRILMERTAPHLVRALPMTLPLARSTSHLATGAMMAGLAAAEGLRAAAGTSRKTLPRPRRLSAVETLSLVPALRRDGLRGGLLGWEGQLIDDARLVVAVARTAAAHGARIITHAEIVHLAGDGAWARDRRTNREFEVRARSVVNAAGVWAGTLSAGVALRPSRGTHLVLDGAALGLPRAGLTLPIAGEHNRYAIALPQRDGRVYVGLTDVEVDPRQPLPEEPTPTEEEIRFLLDAVSAALETPLDKADVLGAYAGLRPLLAGTDGPTADLSRRHAVLLGGDRVITVVGGKLTTYRRMAADAVDAAITNAELIAGRCRTRRLPLVGAARRSTVDSLTAPRRLVERYGTEAAYVRDLGADRLVPGLELTSGEVRFALRHEGALDAADVLDRRTRLGLVPADRALAEPAVADLVSAAVIART